MKYGFREFFQQYKNYIIVLILLDCMVTTALLFATGFKYTIAIIIFAVIMVVLRAVVLYFEYNRRKKRLLNCYQALEEDNNEEKSIESCIKAIRSSGFYEDQIYSAVIEKIKECTEHNYAEMIKEKENKICYIERWIHDIKNPLASIRIICENEQIEGANDILLELDIADSYVEKSLSVSKWLLSFDLYNLKSVSLEKRINNVLIKNKKKLIAAHIKITIHNIGINVFSDERWLEVIIEQMIQNCINYRTYSDPEIEIYSEKVHDTHCLVIKDNGVGIKAEEIPRIFEENFIGTNEVKNNNATGIGLYLCSRLALRLNLRLEAESEYGKYTKMKIFFPTKQ